MWVTIPLGVEWPFHKGYLRPPENTDMIHSRSKTTVVVSVRIFILLCRDTTMATVRKEAFDSGGYLQFQRFSQLRA